MLPRPPIRQLNLGELLDESFRLYRNNFVQFVAIAALVLVPYTVLSLMVQLPLQELIAQQTLAEASGDPFAPGEALADSLGSLALGLGGSLLVGMLYVVVFQPLMEGALAHAVSQRYLDRPTGTGDSFGTALRRAPALIGARLIPALLGMVVFGLIFGLIFGLVFAFLGMSFVDGSSSGSAAMGIMLFIGGFALVVALAIIAALVGVRIFFTSQAVIVEGRGAWSSLKRSWELTKSSFWRVLGYLLVIGFLAWVIATLPATVMTSIMAMALSDQPQLYLVISTSISAIFQIIIFPFSIIAYTLLYYDLRVRKEGFDLEQQASAILASSPPTSLLRNT